MMFDRMCASVHHYGVSRGPVLKRTAIASLRLKRGVFCSIVELQVVINRFLRKTNDDPHTFGPASGHLPRCRTV